MHNILIIGAGLSSSALIHYVLKNAETKGWNVTVADADPLKAEKLITPIIEEPKELTVPIIEKPKVQSVYEKHLEAVEKLLIAEVPHSAIAKIIGVTEQVFERTFSHEIENSLIIANAEVLNAIHLAATNAFKPNPQAQKLWLEIQDKKKAKEDEEVVEVNPYAVEFQAPKAKGK
jgi:cellobiose-specific phosphotransferase system component IIB